MPTTCRAILLALLATACTAAETTCLVNNDTILVTGSSNDCTIGLAAWGPQWKFMNWKGRATVSDGVSVAALSGSYGGSPAPTSLEQRIRHDGAKTITIEDTLSSTIDQQYTQIAFALNLGAGWSGTIDLTHAGGQSSHPWPINRGDLASGISSATMVAADGSRTVFSFDPPIDASVDRQIRFKLADSISAGTPITRTITITFPDAITFYGSTDVVPEEDGKDRWFAWQPQYRYGSDNAFAMGDWNEEAGARGRITRSADELVYDGKPIKLWGLNNCYASCAPDKALADKRAAFYAAHGINAVRLHKWGDGSGWKGILKPGSNTAFDEKMLDQLDYYIAALKKRGIYVKLSNTFGSMSLAADGWDRIPYASDWGAKPAAKKDLRTGAGAIFLSSELQDLHIEQMTTLLQHVNPYTGLSYADDPAIVLVEMCNEESALFGGTLGQLQKSATLRKRAGAAFSAWLLKRYGSAEAVLARWGDGGLDAFHGHEKMPTESFENNAVYPVGGPWYWMPEQLEGSQKPKAARLLDTAHFLKDLQDQVYDRYAKALRDCGYKGIVMASNWQAGQASSHYYNLHSDSRFDVVDRHNYFGGSFGGSMLRIPGGGSLSSGLQQVAGVPFSLSEWIHVRPNQWGAEGPAIIGAYGLGLQGWDISFLFQNRDNGGYLSELFKDSWEVSAPQIMAPFPAIARQVRRMDIAVSELEAPLNVWYDGLQNLDLDFRDQTRQQYDIKLFDSDKVPAEALAVARVAVHYVEEQTPTPAFDLAAHRDADGALVSSNKQLRWMPGDSAESGWFTIDTAATKAVVGFAAGTHHQLGAVTIAPENRYALIYLTAASPDGDLASDQRLLLVASGRCHNTGMKYLDGTMLARGKGPLLMEPVVATITLKRAGTPTVYVCDHDGNRTDQTIPVENGRFTIDGRETKAVYYEIAYE